MEREINLRRLDESLHDNDVEVTGGELESITGFITNAPLAGIYRVMLSDELTSEEKKSLKLQMLAHVVLGHVEKPFSNIIVPKSRDSLRAPLSETEVLRIQHAKELALAMLDGTVSQLWERPDFQVLYSSQKMHAQTVSDQLRKI